MFTGPEIAATLVELGVTHVAWLPDSALGPWEAAFETTPGLRLVRVCREGEAWPLAAGLWLGGKLPVVVMQTTGLFESGDALRNVLYELKLPILAIIGARNWLEPNSRDTAKRFTEPILRAWSLDPVWITSLADKPKLRDHLMDCRETGRSGVVVLGEAR